MIIHNMFTVKNFLRGVLALLCVLAVQHSFTGCSRSSSQDKVVVAIGAAKITIDDLIDRISNLPLKYREVIKKRREEYLDELINDTLLYQEALRGKLDREDDVKKTIEEARKKILIARLLKGRVDDTINISEEDIQGYYQMNKEKFMTPEVLRVSHILVATKEEADRIHLELMSGAVFEETARARSIDPTAQRGGDVGYFPVGQLMPEFEGACRPLGIGEISAPVKTALGFHIIKLTDRRSPQARPLDDVRDNIKAELRSARRQAIFNELIADLRNKTNIRVDNEALGRAVEQATTESPDENKK